MPKEITETSIFSAPITIKGGTLSTFATVQPKLLSVFVPGKLVNPLNSREHHMTRHKREKKQQEATVLAILTALRTAGMKLEAPAKQPKIVTFVVTVERRFDEGDNLQACVKPYRDALIPAIIHQDGVGAGHTFHYRQVLAEGAPTGVAITVELDPRAIGDPRWNLK